MLQFYRSLMARSSLSSGDPNTPWWYETPSLASQSTYSPSTFAGNNNELLALNKPYLAVLI